MKTYLIDGNNLIGKISHFINENKGKDTRGNLVIILESFFANVKTKVKLFFDGYPVELMTSKRIEIIFSRSQTADDLIRFEIENSRSPRTLVVVSSDLEIKAIARACGCEVISSEDFSRMIFQNRFAKDNEKNSAVLSSKDYIEMLKKKYGENI